MTEYFKHEHGCGCGSTKIFIKMDADNNVIIVLIPRWMGGRNEMYELFGEYLLVEKPFGVIKINKVVCNGKSTSVDFYFDSFKMDEEKLTEWGQHVDKIDIGLYAGNGCHSTEKFKFVIYNNVQLDGWMIDDDLKKIFTGMSGLKFNICKELDFETNTS
jgi:hypothetical protein